MGQTRSLSKAQHILQVNLHISLMCIITIKPASSSCLGGAGAPQVFYTRNTGSFTALSVLSSFGVNLSRYVIFGQGTFCVCVFVYFD